jgi:uncharacterized protein (TIGR00255 family)
MIKSMTGFGDASGEVDGIAYFVEIKTVNSRYLKVNVKVSDVASFMADEIEKFLRESIGRGTVNFTLKAQNSSSQALFDIDENALQAYVKKLQAVALASGIESTINIAELLSLPGIIQPMLPDDEQAERIRKGVLDLVVQAVEKLGLMRAKEGQSLAADLISNCDSIRQKLDLIRPKSPSVVKEYHERLKKKVDDLLSEARLELDSDTLAREVAIFAEKCDIAEELTRLDSHIDQFVSFCKEDGSNGRKLDFIAQEMLREANTIGSKASDDLICQYVIDIKCSIDRIKEQVQNVE